MALCVCQLGQAEHDRSAPCGQGGGLPAWPRVEWAGDPGHAQGGLLRQGRGRQETVQGPLTQPHNTAGRTLGTRAPEALSGDYLWLGMSCHVLRSPASEVTMRVCGLDCVWGTGGQPIRGGAVADLHAPVRVQALRGLQVTNHPPYPTHTHKAAHSFLWPLFPARLISLCLSGLSRLRRRNPSPYGFLMNLGSEEYLIGASPEMFVRCERTRAGIRVETCPISGQTKHTAHAGREGVLLRLWLCACVYVRHDRPWVQRPGRRGTHQGPALQVRVITHASS